MIQNDEKQKKKNDDGPHMAITTDEHTKTIQQTHLFASKLLITLVRFQLALFSLW